MICETIDMSIQIELGNISLLSLLLVIVVAVVLEIILKFLSQNVTVLSEKVGTVQEWRSFGHVLREGLNKSKAHWNNMLCNNKL